MTTGLLHSHLPLPASTIFTPASVRIDHIHVGSRSYQPVITEPSYLPRLTLIHNHGLSYLTRFLITYLNYSVMSQSLLEFNLF